MARLLISKMVRFIFFAALASFAALMFLERIFYRQIEDIKVNWNQKWGDEPESAAAVLFRIDPNLNGNQEELFPKLNSFLSKPVPVHAKNAGLHDLSRGIPYAQVRKLAEIWADQKQYNWTKRVNDRFNALGPQYLTVINGLKVHYYDIRAPKEINRNVPIILVHGWPGSIVEFLDVVPFLLGKGHDVIVPSLPGFGFSDAPSQATFSFFDAAILLTKLMKRVHPTQRYVCQGGDYGATVCPAMSQIDESRVLGIHINLAIVPVAPWTYGGVLSYAFMHFFPFLFTKADVHRLDDSVPGFILRILQETGYFHVQASKPDTLGIGLEDSPVFLLAWITEKFRSWASPAEFDAISHEEILDNVQVYWSTRSSTSAARYYYAFARSWDGAIASLLAPVKVPTAIVDAPFEIFRPPKFWLKGHRFPKLQRFTELEKGGHFIALEHPDILANDLLAFIDSLIIGE